MRTINQWLLFVLGVGCLLSLAGCSGSSHSTPPDPMLSDRIGESCTVHFRRDALGTGPAGPIPPMTGNFNGADVNVTGKLLRVNPGWICVVIGQGEYTIPKEVILMIEVRAK